MLRPPNGRRPLRPESVNAEPGSGWALVGNYRDLPDGYEAASLVIADCDCMADCAPRSIAPNDYERLLAGASTPSAARRER
jgi:hypothetical protein